MIRIFIADDHTVLRSGLKMLLNAQVDIEVVGEADSGQQLLASVEDIQPDVVLLDVSMPGLGGLETLPILKKKLPQTHVLMLTMYDDESYLRQALRDGASGYVLKRAADSELLSAIRAVVRGEVYVHSSLTRVLLDDILSETTSKNSTPWDSLSEREREVLIRVARGFTSAKIAEQLNISAKTVDTYRARGMEKLGLRSRAALVQYVLSHGLLAN
ncbi:MAG: response regulator transcription factor [Phototrophicales bacterium]